MSRVERKEYQETKIMRTVSPVRGGKGSTQNLVEFDQNLDHLLEDLQSSVSRPGSSLGNPATNTYRDSSKTVANYDSARTNSLNRVSNLKASNPVTEYSSDDSYSYTSPDGSKSVKAYKKESYSYQTTRDQVPPEKVRIQNNINQLDSLLDDLQQVKQTSPGSYNNAGADPGLQEGKISTSKRTVQRELHYGDTPRSSSGSRRRTLERAEREGSVTRDVQYSAEGTYGDLKTVRHSSPSPSRGDTLSRQTKVTNVHAYPLEVVETTTPDINPEILANLDPTLLPSGNTKVTTTIKTYTYEIPGSTYPATGSTPEAERYVYSPNQTQTTPSKSFVYNKVENNTLTRNVNYTPPPADAGYVIKEITTTNDVLDNQTLYPQPPPQSFHVVKEVTTTNNVVDSRPQYITPSPQPGYHIVKEVITKNNIVDNQPPYQKPTPPGPDRTIIKETVTTRNYQPGYPPHQPDGGYPPTPAQTYIYNETTTKNVNEGYPNDRYPPGGYPPSSRDHPSQPEHTTYIIKETHNTTTNKNYPPQGHPPNQTTIIYKTDTHTSNNNYPDGPYPPNDSEVFDPKHPPYAGSGRPREPVNVTYKYTSHSTTTNNIKGGYPPGDESEPLLHPRPFPVDRDTDGPPKKLDELMANIGNEPPNSPFNASYNAHEKELAQQKKIDSLKQQHEDTQKKEPKDLPPTKNVTGPPVYYPPGHEMFAKKEESGGGAWRAEGAMARESGRYKYEAESKSKMKSSSGAAVIPVCLPLCCGLPCTIL